MKLKFYLSLGLVLLLTALSAWWLRSGTAAPAAKLQVLAMASDRDAGAFIEARDLVWINWKGEVTSPALARHIVKGRAKPETLIGAVLRIPLKQGDFIDTDNIVQPGDSAFLAAVLKAGSRAITIPIDRISGSSGLIQPGNFVDVILTRSSNSGREKSANRVNTMISNARVIAINQKTENIQPSANEASSNKGRHDYYVQSENNLDRGTATLEVSPAQAELLALARNAGDLSLSLRSLLPDNGGAHFGESHLQAHQIIDDHDKSPSESFMPTARPQVIQFLGTEQRRDSALSRAMTN